MKKNKISFSVIITILLIAILILITITIIYGNGKNEKDERNERFDKPEKRNIDVYEKNDVSVDDATNEQVNTGMRTINPVANFIDYTYFNNRNKRHSYNIGFEPQSPLQTERNVSFTIKP